MDGGAYIVVCLGALVATGVLGGFALVWLIVHALREMSETDEG